MALGQVRLKRDCSSCSGFRPGPALFGRSSRKSNTKLPIAISQTRIRQRVPRILIDRPLKVFASPFYADGCSLAPVVAPPEIKLVSFSIFGKPPLRRLLLLPATQLRPQAPEYVPGDSLLDIEDIREL